MSTVRLDDKVSYGTMSLTWKPSPEPLEVSVKSLDCVIEKYGVKFFNGGEFYGPDDINLKLFQIFCNNSRNATNDIVVSIKGGSLKEDNFEDVQRGDKEAIDESIKNVIRYFPPVGAPNRPKILYERARVDPKIPVADTARYIWEHVKTGEIDGVSISEVSAKSIAAAADAVPISAVEVEFSLLTQDIVSNGVLAEASKRGIPIVAYSPLAVGLLTDRTVEGGGEFLKQIPAGDLRLTFDRFKPENFEHNLKLLKSLYNFAHEKKGISLEALALSWITSVSGSENPAFGGRVGKIIPIPSASTPAKIDLNFGNLIELTIEDLETISKICETYEVKGLRYNEHARKHLHK